MLSRLAPAAVAAALCCSFQPVAFADDGSARGSPGDQAADVSADRARDGQPHTLDVIQVTATLDRARNRLSPATGSSEYLIDERTIAQLPLGASTPLNQVILRAPGVVQDSFGELHVRGDHGNLQYRINGVILPESISGFGQALDARMIRTLTLIDGALPAQYGERTAAVIDITTKGGAEAGRGGEAGVTAGSFATFNPFASTWGTSGRLSWYATGHYLVNDVGVESPAAARNPIHDRTNQLRGFGNLAWLVNDDTRLGFMFGMANNRFQVPNRPDQQPEFGYLDRTTFDSAGLDERQNEVTRFGVLSLQGKFGATDYQLALGQRFSGVRFMPDAIGDLMFNGVAAAIDQADRASTLQADFAMPHGDTHTLRYGFYGLDDRARTATDSLVFPADADGGQTSTLPFPITTTTRITAQTAAAYIQDQWDPDDDWTINYGLRADRYRAFGRTEGELGPRAGVVWRASAATALHAGYARYFTPPATELITTKDIGLFEGTTNAVKSDGDTVPRPERSGYYDIGVIHRLGQHLALGLDAYWRRVTDLQDEGQFGAALIPSTFNYARGRVRGAEFTASYDHGPLAANFNLAYGRAMGKDVVTSQYNFDADDLAYIAGHYIHLDHDQRLTASGGMSYAVAPATRVGADYLFGTGLRRDGAVPNGSSLPAYFQLNLGVSHDFALRGAGTLHLRLAVINALDRTYELRDGTGVGVGAPQFGPPRGAYLTVSRQF